MKTASTSRDEANSRGGDDLLELIREPLSIVQQQLYKFNDMTDHDIDVTPGALLEDLNMFNTDYFDSRFQIETNVEKKYITMKLDEEDNNLQVKIKLFDLE